MRKKESLKDKSSVQTTLRKPTTGKKKKSEQTSPNTLLDITEGIENLFSKSTNLTTTTTTTTNSICESEINDIGVKKREICSLLHDYSEFSFDSQDDPQQFEIGYLPLADYQELGSGEASEMTNMIEVSGFDKFATTRDVEMALINYRSLFRLKWIDDTHVIAIFSHPKFAQHALDNFKSEPYHLKPLSQLTSEKLFYHYSDRTPSAPRPPTTVEVANRLILNSLSPEFRQRERERRNMRNLNTMAR